MKISHGQFTLPNGKKVSGTRVEGKNAVAVFTEKISRREALRRFRPFDRNPGTTAQAIDKAARKYREFNWKDPSRIVIRDLPIDVPLVRIGPVPVITYANDKDGKKRYYEHETKRMPTLYMHPDKPFGVLIGGSLKVRDWLYD